MFDFSTLNLDGANCGMKVQDAWGHCKPAGKDLTNMTAVVDCLNHTMEIHTFQQCYKFICDVIKSTTGDENCGKGNGDNNGGTGGGETTDPTPTTPKPTGPVQCSCNTMTVTYGIGYPQFQDRIIYGNYYKMQGYFGYKSWYAHQNGVYAIWWFGDRWILGYNAQRGTNLGLASLWVDGGCPIIYTNGQGWNVVQGGQFVPSFSIMAQCH